MAQITKPMLLDETGKQIVTELQNLTKAISGGGSNNSYTGHVDVEGLKSIGWDDNDIAQLKVCWNEEQDEAFKVTDYDKWYYGYLKTTFGEDLIITNNNKANLLTSEAKNCIHFMPKVNTSSVTNMSNMFNGCYSLVSVNTGIKFPNILNSTQKSLNGQTFINIIERANNTSAFNQTLYMNAIAAKQLYELSCNINESSTWMTKNDGSQSAQTWLAAQAARTDKTHSSYAITLSFASGSSDYSGQ